MGYASVETGIFSYITKAQLVFTTIVKTIVGNFLQLTHAIEISVISLVNC